MYIGCSSVVAGVLGRPGASVQHEAENIFVDFQALVLCEEEDVY